MDRRWFPRIRANRHDDAVFETLLRPHLDTLYRLAYRLTGAADRAEDLVQDLLVRLYSRSAELAEIEQLRPWLVRVLYRLFVDDVRRRTRSPLVPIDDSEFSASEFEGDSYAGIEDTAPGPEAEVELNFTRDQLHQAWEHLSPDHRALLALHDIEGYTLTELEEMLEVTRGTLKSRLHRAHAHLRELLAMEPFSAPARVIRKRNG